MPQREEPLQSYYPSARVRLIVRFEDYGDPSTPTPPETLPQLRRGITDADQAVLQVQEENGQFILVGRTSVDRFTHAIDSIIPISASWSQNGIRIADTLTLDIEYRDFPVDPKIIRSCAVQFFLGTVSPDDFQLGIDGVLRSHATPADSRVPYNVIPDEYTDATGRAVSNLRFQGWVDEWDADFPETEGAMISLSCTDNTRLLIDQLHPSRLAVSISEPIDQAIANYLANFPQFVGMSVEFQPRGEDAPVMEGVLAANAFPPGVGPSTAKDGTSTGSVWDYLTDVTSSIGLNIRFIGTRVVIIRPRALYNRKFPPRFDDPFKGRDLPRLGHLDKRLMIYGRNIKEMQFNRQFTNKSVKNVEIRSYNPQRKKTLIARFPEIASGKRQKSISPGNAAESKFTVHSIPGIQDMAVLRSLAQQLYEQVGRNETGVTVLTKNLASFGGGNLDPDLLDMQPGDAIDVRIERENLEEHDFNTVTTTRAEIARRPGAYLRDLGFPSGFADSYAEAINNAGFSDTYRVREVHIDWDKTSEGITIDFDAVNYIEVRADAELPGDEEQKPDAGAGAPEPSRNQVQSPGNTP